MTTSSKQAAEPDLFFSYADPQVSFFTRSYNFFHKGIVLKILLDPILSHKWAQLSMPYIQSVWGLHANLFPYGWTKKGNGNRTTLEIRYLYSVHYIYNTAHMVCAEGDLLHKRHVLNIIECCVFAFSRLTCAITGYQV